MNSPFVDHRTLLPWIADMTETRTVVRIYAVPIMVVTTKLEKR